MYGLGQGSVTRTLPFVVFFAYSSNVLEWMEPSDARLIFFHTSYPLAQQSCGGDIGSVPYVCM